ncbi:hypothetical protein E0H65_35660 [Rhizobium leguminosarum bv. viciae]|nr:hypothetical protein E0H65_35660 [Rhizobium leguminosarum bv. viciae]
MDASPKVLVSAAKRRNLSSDQNAFLNAVIDRISHAGFTPIDGDDSEQLSDQISAIQQIQGVVVIAFAQWRGTRVHADSDERIFPSEFCHLHITAATALGKPLLVLREKIVAERGVLRPALGCRAVRIAPSLTARWLDSPEFVKEFSKWSKEISSAYDVFFGYSGAASDTANQINVWLVESGLKVLDWKSFAPSGSIFSRIEQASRVTKCGLFLMTADDAKLVNEGQVFTPRDNVIFEAGYFANAKGLDRILIVHESGISLPSDLGGIIYVGLDNRHDTTSIQGSLSNYFERILKAPASMSAVWD